MGLEAEKLDTSVTVDEDELELDGSTEPVWSERGTAYPAAPRRDPNDTNKHLKIGFEDVIAEPASARSFDRVWVGSHATFELVRFLLYRLLTALLAVPAAFILGLVFGLLSCVHIWLVTPLIQSFLMMLPPLRVAWRSLTDVFVTPLFHSVGKSLSSIRVETSAD